MSFLPPRSLVASAAAATSAGLIAQQVAGKAARDALFLSSFHTTSLPHVMAVGAVLSLGGVLWLSRLMARYSPATVTPILFGVSASAFALEWVLGLASAPAAAVAVYLHTALFGPAVISSFWSLINERFDPHTAKREVARIAGGGTLGGVLGGLAAWRASSLIQLPTALLCLAALNALCVVGTLLIRAHREVQDGPASKSRASSLPPSASASALGVFKGAPFLRNLAILVALGAAMSALLDYIFSAQAVAAYGKGPPLLAFFSFFWLVVGVLSFLLQMALGRVALEKLGLAVNIAILPGVVLFGGALGLAVPGLASACILRGAEAVQRNTLFRSAYELLFTPLSEGQKRSTKALIDVGFDRLGTVVGSGVLMVALRLFTSRGASFILTVVVVLALLTLPVARRLHIGYIAALQQGLRDGAKRLDLPPLEDQRLSTFEMVESLARDRLIERVEALKPGGLSALLATDVVDAEAPGVAREALHRPQRLLAETEALLSSDVERARRALRGWPVESTPIAAFAILLLSHKDLYLDALRALRGIAVLITGQLVDALVDPAMDFVVRRRIPRALAVCASQRATDGLLVGLADDRFEVRYECARALLKVMSANEALQVPREKVIEAILREVDKAKEVVAPELDDDASEVDQPNPLVRLLVQDRVGRSLEHVFTILSLHLEREPLRMAYQALHHANARYRGTALEYLEAVLPSEVRDAVWPLLGSTEPLPPRRPAQEILADLVNTTVPEPAPTTLPELPAVSAASVT